MTEFEWPWQYSFPPFYTFQPHIETRSKQLSAWKTLILDYYKAEKLYMLDINETKLVPLFHNADINRTIDRETLLATLEQLQSSGHASPLDKSKNRWEIYWHTLAEFGDLLYNYAANSNNLNTVLTLYELSEGAEVEGEVFFKVNTNVLIKALRLLEGDGKCELIMFDDNQGVKFF